MNILCGNKPHEKCLIIGVIFAPIGLLISNGHIKKVSRYSSLELDKAIAYLASRSLLTKISILAGPVTTIAPIHRTKRKVT